MKRTPVGRSRSIRTASASSSIGNHTGVGNFIKSSRAALTSVVKSQAEALEGDVTYDYCLITTKCLPDVLPTPKLVEDVISSGKVKAWSLIQVSLVPAIVAELMAERSRCRGGPVRGCQGAGHAHHLQLRLDRDHDEPGWAQSDLAGSGERHELTFDSYTAHRRTTSSRAYTLPWRLSAAPRRGSTARESRRRCRHGPTCSKRARRV